jgi:hypothetical protein
MPPLPKSIPVQQTFCSCGHWIGIHKYNYELEEFDGCQLCISCPSVETFAVVKRSLGSAECQWCGVAEAAHDGLDHKWRKPYEVLSSIRSQLQQT